VSRRDLERSRRLVLPAIVLHNGLEIVEAFFGCQKAGACPVPVNFRLVERDGRTVTEAELVAHCRGRLAGYKKPSGAAFVDALRARPSSASCATATPSASSPQTRIEVGSVRC
jgi:hypothetical protein